MKKTLLLGLMLILTIPLETQATPNLANQLKGRILLQVEGVGQSWYVDPITKQRAFLGRPDDAFRIMRELGLGISEKDYNSFYGYAPSWLSGRILLRVEAHGEAYYVNPVDLKMHYLGRPADAFQVMRNLGLGIANKDLDTIEVNTKYSEKEVNSTYIPKTSQEVLQNVETQKDNIEMIDNDTFSTSTSEINSTTTIGIGSLDILKNYDYADQEIPTANLLKIGSFMLIAGKEEGIKINQVNLILSSEAIKYLSDIKISNFGTALGNTINSPQENNSFNISVDLPALEKYIFDIYANVNCNASDKLYLQTKVEVFGTGMTSSFSFNTRKENLQLLTFRGCTNEIKPCYLNGIELYKFSEYPYIYRIKTYMSRNLINPTLLCTSEQFPIKTSFGPPYYTPNIPSGYYSVDISSTKYGAKGEWICAFYQSYNYVDKTYYCKTDDLTFNVE